MAIRKLTTTIQEKTEMEYLRHKIAEIEKNMNAMAEKIGYNIIEAGETEAGSKIFEFEKDSENQAEMGEYLNPIQYEMDITVETGKFYTDGENIWEAILGGVPTGFDDKRYFDIIED